MTTETQIPFDFFVRFWQHIQVSYSASGLPLDPLQLEFFLFPDGPVQLLTSPLSTKHLKVAFGVGLNVNYRFDLILSNLIDCVSVFERANVCESQPQKKQQPASQWWCTNRLGSHTQQENKYSIITAYQNRHRAQGEAKMAHSMGNP